MHAVKCCDSLIHAVSVVLRSRHLAAATSAQQSIPRRKARQAQHESQHVPVDRTALRQTCTQNKESTLRSQNTAACASPSQKSDRLNAVRREAIGRKNAAKLLLFLQAARAQSIKNKRKLWQTQRTNDKNPIRYLPTHRETVWCQKKTWRHNGCRPGRNQSASQVATKTAAHT